MGGLGKSQLSLAIAQRVASRFRDGQLLVLLRGTSQTPVTPIAALQSIIRAFNRETILPDDLTELQAVHQAVLTGKRVLILADDARAAAQVRPLAPPPGCALLITSRQRFALPGMIALDLGILDEPTAIQLVRTICPRVSDQAAELAALCGYLPLAVRVSASLLASSDTRNISRFLLQLRAARLAHLRDPEAPDDPEVSVEASLRLSYDALDHTAQRGLCQLGIFAASFDLVAAEAVLEANSDVESLLDLLRRRSLLEWEPHAERYRLHDLVRAFAIAQLEPQDQQTAYEHSAQHYLALAEAADEAAQSAQQTNWWNRLEADHDNIRAVLRWLIAQRSELGLRMTVALWSFWCVRGYVQEGRSWFEVALASRNAEPSLRAKALVRLGNLAYQLGNIEPAVAYCEAGLALSRSAGDHPTLALGLLTLGNIAQLRADYDEAAARYEEGLALYRAMNDMPGAGFLLVNLGRVARAQGEQDRAQQQIAEGLELFRTIGDKRGIATALVQLGEQARLRGDGPTARALGEESLGLFRELRDIPGIASALIRLGEQARLQANTARSTRQDAECRMWYQQAEQYYAESLAFYRELGHKRGISGALHNLAYVELYQGRGDVAASHFRESMTIKHRDLQDTVGVAGCLTGLAAVAAQQGQGATAARFFGASQALLDIIGQQPGLSGRPTRVAPADQAERAYYLNVVRRQLDEATFGAAWAGGQAMPLEQAVDEALGTRD